MVYHLVMPTELEPRYTLTELADLAGVTPRTVRYYISQGLLTVEVASGPGPKYSDANLARLRLIKRLQREHQPLAEIRRQLADLDDPTILALSDTEPIAAPTDSALDYIARVTGSGRPRASAQESLLRRMEMPRAAMAMPSADLFAPTAPAAPVLEPSTSTPTPRLERSQWERVDLAPDVELHFRRPLSRATAKQVDRLISIARDLFREEPS